jgi:heavy metal translocating P-type ATPase
MLSGGQALEGYAVRSASAVLQALARRMPSLCHRNDGSTLVDVPVSDVVVGNVLTVFPHEVCPVDGVVLDGHGGMDESYLTGEPFRILKAPGSEVISGSMNGEVALRIRATKLAVDSRYAKIMRVMRASERDTPRLRRLGDQLGAFYTPLAIVIAITAWLVSGHPDRFLAVLVVATPCPLLIGIPVAIIGAVSLAARRGIIVRKPAVLEQVGGCRTIIFDKTGTLTYGEPVVAQQTFAHGLDPTEVLGLIASLERYSKHPLAGAVLAAAGEAGAATLEATAVSEPPGAGLTGIVGGKKIEVTSRKKLLANRPELAESLTPSGGGMECVIVIDGRYAGTLSFRDEVRSEGQPFIRHLGPRHRFRKLIILSGDRESEVRYLAEQVGIDEVYAEQSPEQKLELVRRETSVDRTLYVGDGINDAPALVAATVGIALGQNSDVTGEAAGAVIMDSSLRKIDEFLHISLRMRRIAMQSAVGGMALSTVGMLLASAGYLPPVAGAIAQEVIDVLAVVNALRAAVTPKSLTDF